MALEFVDRPDLVWTFADSITSVVLENKAICRVELCAVRWNDLPSGSAPTSGKQYPICRLVVPLKVMIDLHRRIGNILDQLAPDELSEPVVRQRAIN
jgi:hypothetical protein